MLSFMLLTTTVPRDPDFPQAGGYDVGLYNNPEVIRQLSTDKPWTTGGLGDLIEEHFKPVANGLPQNIFTAQLER